MSGVLADRVASLELSATDEIDNIVRRMKRKGVTDIISLGGGEPCFDTPENIQDAAERALRGGKTKYQPTTGDYELRTHISRKLREENGIDAEADDIIVTPGGKFAIYLTLQALLEPGDSVLLLEPAWVSYKSMAQLSGARVVTVDCTEANGFVPDLEDVAAAMDESVRAVVVNSPSNPTGAVYDGETLRGIADIAAGHDAFVVADEVYEYMVYAREHYSPASEFDNVVTVNSFSKSYAMTGWRLGYVTGPKELLDGMVKIYQHSATCVTAFAQAGATEALTSEMSREASARMMQGYQERCELIFDLLDQSAYFDTVRPEGAFYIFPSYELEMSSLDLAKGLLEEAHVATVPGSAFGKSGEGYLRLCYSASKDSIVEAVERMERFIEERV